MKKILKTPMNDRIRVNSRVESPIRSAKVPMIVSLSFSRDTEEPSLYASYSLSPKRELEHHK